MSAPPSVGQALARAVARLSGTSTAACDPGRDARALVAHALGIDRGRLTLHLHDQFPPEAAARLDRLVLARLRGQPVAQITGQRLFWGRAFRVTPDVLDPRPETETLVAAALEYPFSRLLDLGTGTGALAISLLAERPKATGVATDISPAALAVAEENARALGVEARLALVQGSWFGPVSGQFDLIVSNPPYIAAAEMPALSPEVRDWEPHLALTDGGDGLGAYRALAAGLAVHLAPGGRALFEIGWQQGQSAAALFAAAGFDVVQVLCDMDGRDRVVLVQHMVGQSDQ
jgi:release factor glutamine methyltransferase